MAKGAKKKTRKQPLPAFLPINRDGSIRTATAAIEGGLALAALEVVEGGRPIDHFQKGEFGLGAQRYVKALNPLKTLAGKLVVVGVTIKAIVGGKKKFGPLKGN